MKVLVIPDIHGKVDLLTSMLDEHGDADRIIQVGDLANCVSSSRDGDLECIKIAKEAGIEVLIGNHEYPHFEGPGFSGYYPFTEVREALKSLDLKAAAVVDGTLITHAGLHPLWPMGGSSAEAACSEINEMWKFVPTAAIFASIGAKRGGSDPCGGILWRDHREACYAGFPQVYGHSKGAGVRVNPPAATCIDCEEPFVMAVV